MINPRYAVSKATWDLNNIEQIEINDNVHKRLCDDNYRKVPYIKDVIDKGIEIVDSKNNYIILLTNSDSCLLPSVEDILDNINDNTTLVLGRRDVYFDFNKPLTKEDIVNCSCYEGKDGFAFTKNFWLKNRDVFLDTVFGAEFWDYLFYLHLKMNSNLIKDNDSLYHKTHENSWSNIENRVFAASQLHNIKLAKEFLYKNYDQVDYKELFKEWEEGVFKFV
jgi:hypothetical protein